MASGTMFALAWPSSAGASWGSCRPGSADRARHRPLPPPVGRAGGLPRAPGRAPRGADGARGRGAGRRSPRAAAAQEAPGQDRAPAGAGRAGGSRRPGMQVAAQLGLAAVLALVADLMWGMPLAPAAKKSLVMLPVIGLILPSARLKRRIRKRTDTIFKDLPTSSTCWRWRWRPGAASMLPSASSAALRLAHGRRAAPGPAGHGAGHAPAGGPPGAQEPDRPRRGPDVRARAHPGRRPGHPRG